MLEETKANKAEKNRFTKEQLKESKRFRANKDLIQAVIEDGEMYSIEEAQKELDKFLKGKVN